MAYPINCVGCGLDITKTPKIRRNLGEEYKGHEREASERVLSLWKELLRSQGHEPACSENNLRMCRTCFNSYDKVALSLSVYSEKLKAALNDLNKYASSTTEELNYSQLTPPIGKEGRKRKPSHSQACGDQSKKHRRPPVMLPNNSATFHKLWYAKFYCIYCECNSAYIIGNH